MNKIVKKSLACIVLGTMTVSLWAQPLTLEMCRQRALDSNKSLATAKLKLEQTTFDMKSYRANFFPQFTFLLTDFYSTAHGDVNISGGHLPIYHFSEASGQFVPSVTQNADGSYTLNEYADFPSQSMKWKLKNIFVGGISVMEPIYSGGKISTAYRMARIGVGMAKEHLRLSETEVLVKTDEAFYQVVKAKELGDVARSYKSVLEELKKNVDAAYLHGLSTRNDQMKVQVKLNEAELSIQKADNGYRLALMNLCHIIGAPLDCKIDVDAEQASRSAEADVPGADGSISNRPEFVLLENKTELARQNVKLTRSDFLPTVAAGASYSYLNGGEVAGKKLLSDGVASVGIAVKIPVHLFGDATNKVRSAHAAHQIAQMEQQDLSEQMMLELAQCRNIYEEAQTELRLCQAALEQATENMRLSKQQYEVGFETLSDHLESQTLWQKSNADVVNARCQLQLAKTKLLKAAGAL